MGFGKRGIEVLQTVLDALQQLRSPFACDEADIHRLVARRLADAGLPCVHEARLGPGCRIDFLVGNVGIEIKKGKPDAAALQRQLARYAACEDVEAIVLLTQRAVRVSATALGKPVRVIMLNQLWGVALP